MTTGATPAETSGPLGRAPAAHYGRPLLWALPAMALAAGAGLLAASHLEIALCILLAVGAAIAIAINPLYALLLVLVLRASFTDSLILDIATGVGGLIAIIAAAPRLPAPRVTVPLALLLLLALPSVPLTPSLDEGTLPEALYLPGLGLKYADYPSAELFEWLRLLMILAVGGLAGWAIRDRRSLQLLTVVIGISAIFPCIDALHQFASGNTFNRPGSSFDSVTGPFPHPNYFAFYLVVAITITTIAFLEARSRIERIATALSLGLATVCLALTYTRSAWVGLAVVLVVLALLRDRRIIAWAGLTLIIASIAFPATREGVQERFGALGGTQTNGSESDESWAWRTGQWERMVPYGFASPMTGEGFGSYSRVTFKEFGSRDPVYSTVLVPSDPLHSPRGFLAHNDYVKMFVEMGFPGLILWIGVLAGMAGITITARRVPEVRSYADGGLALVIALVIMSASDNIQGYTAVLVYSLALLGGIAGAAQGIRSQRAATR